MGGGGVPRADSLVPADATLAANSLPTLPQRAIRAINTLKFPHRLTNSRQRASRCYQSANPKMPVLRRPLARHSTVLRQIDEITMRRTHAAPAVCPMAQPRKSADLEAAATSHTGIDPCLYVPSGASSAWSTSSRRCGRWKFPRREMPTYWAFPAQTFPR